MANVYKVTETEYKFVQSGERGAQGPQGIKGDTGDVTPEVEALRDETVAAKNEAVAAKRTVPLAIIYQNALKESMIIPENALQQVRDAIFRRDILKIAIVGDSITEGADQNNPNDAYIPRFIDYLKKIAPNITIEYFNFSLGGRTIANFNDPTYVGLASDPADKVGGFYRPWSVLGKSWKDHVKEFEPDLIICAFGMNQVSTDPIVSSSQYPKFNSFTTEINTWPKLPDVVIVIPMLCTATQNEGKDTWFTQSSELTQALARMLRQFSSDKKYAYADVNRLYNILLNGYDDVTRYAFREKDFDDFTHRWSGAADYPFVNTNTIQATSAGKMLLRNRKFYNGTIKFTLFQGAVTANGDYGAHFLFRWHPTYGGYILATNPLTNGTTEVRIYYRTNYSQSATSLYLTTINKSANANIAFVVEVTDNKIKVTADNTVIIDITSIYKMHTGKIGFYSPNSKSPHIKLFDSIYYDPLGFTPPITISDISAGLYTEDELLGNASYDEGRIQSGNSLNHPSGMGHALFYYPPFIALADEIQKIIKYGGLMAGKVAYTDVVFTRTSGTWPNTTDGKKLFYATFPLSELPINRIVYVEDSTGKRYNRKLITGPLASTAQQIYAITPDEFIFGVSVDGTVNQMLISGDPSETSMTLSFDVYTLV